MEHPLPGPFANTPFPLTACGFGHTSSIDGRTLGMNPFYIRCREVRLSMPEGTMFQNPRTKFSTIRRQRQDDGSQ